LDLDDDEVADLMAAVQAELARKRRKGRAVRLEVGPDMSPDVLFLLLRELELGSEDVYPVTGMLDFTGLPSIQTLGNKALISRGLAPATQPRLQADGGGPVDFFTVIRDRDLLVHHPYDSFKTSVDAFVEQAAQDQDVLAIKIAMY